MEGFYFKRAGGIVNGIDQVVGELHLPPGSYIVFAKAYMAVASNPTYQPDTFSTAYRAILECSGDRDELIGGLKWDYDDPGSRFESIALNVAAVDLEGPVRLLISATIDNKLLCFEPRISAIQLDALHITSEREDHSSFRSRMIASAPGLLTGLSLEELSKLYG